MILFQARPASLFKIFLSILSNGGYKSTSFRLRLPAKIHSHWRFLMCILCYSLTQKGKSTLLHSFLDPLSPITTPLPTIGVSFSTKTLEIETRRIKLQIFDTAGQERFRGLTRSYWRNAIVAILVYSITSRESFESCENWLKDLRESDSSLDIIVLLLANKTDLEGNYSKN